jgi:nanoRNase/pAp phosphatase (c-di-AMP/oligoRNAs hydrolase)
LKDIKQLEQLLCTGQRLIVFLHDNPDPDTIASGWFLAQLAENLGLRTKMVYGGTLGRAENRAMVTVLKIPLERFPGKVHLMKTDLLAMVETQHGTGNNSFPANHRANIVIDHHSSKAVVQADYIDVRPEIGCCTTMLVDYFEDFGLTPDPYLATAASYAILSETQDLKREATKEDLAAYQSLSSLILHPLLGRIRHPARSRDYYRTIARAMQQVMLAKNTCICHIGAVPYPEVVAELADLLVAMDKVSWCMVTGFHNQKIVISLRATQPGAVAEEFIRVMLDGLGRGGGHGLMAGGAADCPSFEEYEPICLELTQRFEGCLCRKVRERFTPLIERIQESPREEGA